MDAALKGQRRYLAALLEACWHSLVPHANQLAALEREVALAAATDDLASYRAAGEDLFELTRGAWLDRIANHARVAAAVDDPWGVEAAAVEQRHVLAATAHGDFATSVAGAETSALATRGADARSSFARLLLYFFSLHGTADEVERAEVLEYARATHRTLRGADPGFAWQPRYRLRTPWTGSALERVRRWIDGLGEPVGEDVEPADALPEIEGGEERWRSQLAARAPGAAAANELTVEDVVGPYRALAEALAGDDRVAAATRDAALAAAAAGAGAPTAQDALARLVADGHLTALAAAPLRARAEDALERLATWPDPLVEHHWRSLLDGLDGARTPTEVDLVSVHADACFAVEADWNAALFAALLAPARAAAVYGRDEAGAGAGVDRAAEAAFTLVGLGPRRLLDVPRVADFVERILVPLAADDSPALGAFEGEAGFETLREVQLWRPSHLPVALLELLDRAGAREPPAQALPVTLWGTTVGPDDLIPALTRPNRPPIPGFGPVRASAASL